VTTTESWTEELDDIVGDAGCIDMSTDVVTDHAALKAKCDAFLKKITDAIDRERARWSYKADGLEWHRGYRAVNGETVEVTEAVITKPQWDEERAARQSAERNEQLTREEEERATKEIATLYKRVAASEAARQEAERKLDEAAREENAMANIIMKLTNQTIDLQITLATLARALQGIVPFTYATESADSDRAHQAVKAALALPAVQEKLT